MKQKSVYFTVRVDISFDESAMTETDAVVIANEEIDFEGILSDYAQEQGLLVDNIEVCDVEY